jgi:hypothetical protein
MLVQSRTKDAVNGKNELRNQVCALVTNLVSDGDGWRTWPQAAAYPWTKALACAVATLAVATAACGCTLSTRPAAAKPRVVSVPPSVLTVEEYPIVPFEQDTPDHLEYMQRIPVDVLAQRDAWRGPSPQRRLDAANAALAAFGFRLELEPTPVAQTSTKSYALLQGDRVVLAGVQWFRPPSVNAAQTNFALLVHDSQDRDWLVGRDDIAPWQAGSHAYMAPVYVGNDLVTLDAEAGPTEHYTLRKAGKTVCSVAVPGPQVDNPIKGLWSWQGHWVLEVAGQVVMDGENLGRTRGYAEVFGWQLLHGQPFYFFKQEDCIHISYAGQVLPYTYDEVIHYRCCEPAAFNVGSNADMVWFHALRDGMWCYVELGVYTDNVQQVTVRERVTN